MKKKRNIYRTITVIGAAIGWSVILLTTHFNNNDLLWTQWYPSLRVVGITGLIMMIVGLLATTKTQDRIDEGLENIFLNRILHEAPAIK